jgi:hypothetical protein
MAVALVYGDNHSFGTYEPPPFTLTADVVDGDNLLVLYVRRDFAYDTMATSVDGVAKTPLTGAPDLGGSRETPVLIPLIGMTAGIITIYITGVTYCPSIGIYVIDMNGYDISAITSIVTFNFGYRNGQVPDRSNIPREPFQTLVVPTGGVGITIYTSDLAVNYAGTYPATPSTPFGYNEDAYCTRLFLADTADYQPWISDPPYSGEDMIGFAFGPASAPADPLYIGAGNRTSYYKGNQLDAAIYVGPRTLF